MNLISNHLFLFRFKSTFFPFFLELNKKKGANPLEMARSAEEERARRSKFIDHIYTGILLVLIQMAPPEILLFPSSD